MTEREFCFWLHGFMAACDGPLTKEDAALISERLRPLVADKHAVEPSDAKPMRVRVAGEFVPVPPSFRSNSQ